MSGMFLLATNVNGDILLGGTSNDPNHPGWVEIGSLSFGSQEATVSTSRDALGQQGDMTVWRSATSGARFDFVWLDRTDGNGTTTLRMLLTDAGVSSVSSSGSDTEMISFRFRELSIPYRASGETARLGSDGSAVDGDYDGDSIEEQYA